MSEMESNFDELLRWGLPASAVRAALAQHDPWDPVATIARVERVAGVEWPERVLSDAGEERAGIERAHAEARRPLPSAVSSLWSRRSPDVGVAAFPIAHRFAAFGTVRWVRASVALHASDLPAEVQPSLQAARVVLGPGAVPAVSFDFLPALPTGEEMDGGSWALAAAVAIVSSVTGLAVAPGVAYTGRVEPNGALSGVASDTFELKHGGLLEFDGLRTLVAPHHEATPSAATQVLGSYTDLRHVLHATLDGWAGWAEERSRATVAAVDRGWRYAEEVTDHLVDALSKLHVVVGPGGVTHRPDDWERYLDFVQQTLAAAEERYVRRARSDGIALERQRVDRPSVPPPAGRDRAELERMARAQVKRAVAAYRADRLGPFIT